MLKMTLKNIYDNSNSYNLVGQVTWLFIFLMSVNFESGLLESTKYQNYFGWFWLIALIAYLIGFLSPCKTQKNARSNIGIPLLVYVFWIFQASVAVVVTGFRNLDFSEFTNFTADHLVYFTTSFFAAGSVAIGWFVHAQTQKSAQRKQHTVNVLNSSRVSDVYQQKLESYIRVYSPKSPIKKEDVELFDKYRSEDDFVSKENLWKDNKIKLKAMYGALYLLNFYEFMSVGVKEGDLDDDYLYETISFIAENLFSATDNLVHYQRKLCPDAYIHIEKQIHIWIARREIESRTA